MNSDFTPGATRGPPRYTTLRTLREHGIPIYGQYGRPNYLFTDASLLGPVPNPQLPEPVVHEIKFRRVTVRATPLYKNPGDAGYHLFSAEDIIVDPRTEVCVRTDIEVELPANTFVKIYPRSGFPLYQHLQIASGIIDSNFRGPILLSVINHAEFCFNIKVGDRLALLVLEQVLPSKVTEVEAIVSTDSQRSERDPRLYRPFGSAQNLTN